MANVLVISPHPDDEAIGCGGAIRTHVLAGDEVDVVFLTSGEGGGHGLDPAETAARREAEAVEAGHILGTAASEFWRQPDGRLRVQAALVERLVGKLEADRPSQVYVTHGRESHPDHRAAFRMVQAAVRGMPATSRPQLRAFEVWTPLATMSHVIDISGVIDVKLAAIRAHRTQCDAMRFDDAFQALARYRGEMHLWPGGDYAEVFLESTP